ncbi:transmembrane protein 26 X2 [Biomphalaria glabrata]|nr:Biomphalaria glabrata transmembrane protein 26-like; transcript variant X2 [Biomphalaria glabrata]KAI8794771.1 transmembrane protein 26 X2 [Biomphalaria glabrata]
MAVRSEKASDYHRKQGDEIEIKHKLGVTNTSSSLVAWNVVSVLENTPLQVFDETGFTTRVQGDLASPLRSQASADRIYLKSALSVSSYLPSSEKITANKTWAKKSSSLHS